MNSGPIGREAGNLVIFGYRMFSPTVVLLDSWPQPSGTPEAVLFATETKLLLRYFTENDETAVIQFPLVKAFQFGAPNDEALAGHPLFRYGLKF